MRSHSVPSIIQEVNGYSSTEQPCISSTAKLLFFFHSLASQNLAQSHLSQYCDLTLFKSLFYELCGSLISAVAMEKQIKKKKTQYIV